MSSHHFASKPDLECRPFALGVSHEQSVAEVGAVLPAVDRSATLLQTILDSLSEGLVAVDRDGKFIQFNPMGQAILGIGPIHGPSENWSREYGLFLADAKTPFPHSELPLIRALRGEYVRDVEMYQRGPGQTEGRWLRVTSAPLRDADDNISGAVVLFRDATETKRAQDALETERRYLRHLIQMQDRDRQLTAYDLHDGVVQLMTGALLHLEAGAAKRTPDSSPSELEELSKAKSLIREALEEARRLIGGLRPTALDELGVGGALRQLIEAHAAETGLIVDLQLDLVSPRLPSLVESTIFRVVQEALQNVVRHAAVDRADVAIREHDESIEVEVRDASRGFELRDCKRRRYGLRGMEERTQLLGGQFHVESAPGRGTRIQIQLPIAPAAFESDES